MRRNELSLRIGLAVIGANIPRTDETYRWAEIHKVNHASVAIRYISQPQLGVRWF